MNSPEDYSPGYRQYLAAKRRAWLLLIMALVDRKSTRLNSSH